MQDVLSTLPPRSLEDIRRDIRKEGLDPRLLVIPPPLAIDFDPGAAVEKIPIPNMSLDQRLSAGTVSGREYQEERGGERQESKLLKAFFKFNKSFVGDIIESYNAFVRRFTFPDRLVIKNTNVQVVFNNPRFTKPSTVKDGVTVPLYPAAARGAHHYLTKLYADIQKFAVDDDGNRTPMGDPQRNVLVGMLPVMVGSILCRTHGMTDDEKLSVGEDPHDPQGYFIVAGYEKTLSIKEALRENRIFLYESRSEYGKECRFTTTNNYNKTSIITRIFEYAGMIRIFYNHYPSKNIGSFRKNLTDKDLFGKTLNVLQIFRIFGIKDDISVIVQKYILRFVRDKWKSTVLNKLAGTIANFNVQGDYLTYVLEKFSDTGNNASIIPGDTEEEMRKTFVETCRRSFLSHMTHDSDENRLMFYGLMIARFAEYSEGLRWGDDRDDWANKQFALQGRTIERLFVKSWRRLISLTEKEIENSADHMRMNIDYIARKIDYHHITNDFVSAFVRAVWGIANDPKPEPNMTETLSRQSLVATLTHLTKIAVKTVNTNPSHTIRSVQPSQFNYVCPVDTPENLKIGIVKHRAIGCVASMDRSEVYVEKILEPYLFRLGQASASSAGGVSCILNGRYLGSCDGTRTYNYLLGLRRSGVLDFDTMIIHDTYDNILYINNDDNRPICPYLVVNLETEHLVIEEKNLWGAPWETLISQGAVEYVDAFEAHYIKLATDYGMLDMARKTLQNLIDERKRLIDMEESGEDDASSGQPTGVVNVDEDETLRQIKDNLDIIKREHSDTIKQKKEWISKDISWKDQDARHQRVDKVRMLQTKERELMEKIGSLTRQISTRSAELSYVKPSLSDRIRDLDARIAKENKRRRFSHMMLSPDSMFSFSASIIPLPGTIFAPRVSYQCSKGNQALGFYASNFPIRMDHNAKVLVWPSRPLFKTHMHDVIGMSDLPGGELAVIAVMPWGGFNQEDAIILSEHAVKRGLFAHIVYYVLTSSTAKSDDFVEEFGPPPSREGRNKFLFEAVGDDGFPIVGKYVKEGQAYACKHRRIHGVAKPVVKVDRDKITFSSEGIIERVVRTTHSDGTESIHVKIRQYAKPIEGDKLNMSSGAQKATISKILPESEMPYMFGRDGRKIYPDLIFNPHSMPSRRTIGSMMELLMSKAAVYEGREIDATGFRPIDLESAIQYLKSKGFDPYGREEMYHPQTHKPIEAMIFAGLAYYNVLPQMVRSKVRARNRGPLKAMTRQPSRGGDSSSASGLRLGNQEATALLSHGASEIIHERFVKASDEYVQPFCVSCGRPADYNVNTGVIGCKFCGDKATFGKVTYPFSYKLLVQLLEAAGLGARFGFDSTMEDKTIATTVGENPVSGDEQEEPEE